MSDLTYTAVTLTDEQIEKAARATASAADYVWDQIPSREKRWWCLDAQWALEAVLPEILNAHTAMYLSRIAKAKAVHDAWAGVHHDSATHQLLTELHQALFGGEPS